VNALARTVDAIFAVVQHAPADDGIDIAFERV